MSRKKSTHFQKLQKRWLKKHKLARRNFHKKHKEAFSWVAETFPDKQKLASSAIGALMLSSVIPSSTVLGAITSPLKNEEAVQEVNKTDLFLDEILKIVPSDVRELTQEEEVKVSQVLSHFFQMNVKAEIDSKKLNRSYGLIGAEQHLVRFPGDSMATHLDPEFKNDQMIYSSGMAPGRGAWGYFAKSQADFSEKDKERERWYIAVQTFLVPDYNAIAFEYRDFFRYRKMLVVNTKTGQAVVVDIADAGPAKWTGKHLGGSPEVMYHLGFGEGSRKGPVLYYFVDDPDDTIPLGPVKL